MEAHFGQHPAAEIILSQPGLGPILGARVLAEFGDAEGRYASAKCRKNYAGTSPITRASGKKKVVLARFVHNDRLIDALDSQAFAALTASPTARACRVGGGGGQQSATSARPTEPLVQFSRKRLSMGVALLAVVFAHAGNQLQKVDQPVFTVEAGLR